MINLKFEARGQKLKRTDNINIAAFARNQHYAEFVTDDVWSDKNPLTAQFIKDGTAYDVFVENGRCLIPWEVIEERGKVDVCLIGGDLLTTNTVSISVLSSGVIGGLIPTVSSPTVYSYIMELANDIENRVEEIAKGDFSNSDVMVGTLYFKKNSDDDYAAINMGSDTGIRILNNIEKSENWFIKIGDGDKTGEIENGIQFRRSGEFIVKTKENDIIRLTEKGGADNVIKGNERLKIESANGCISFESENAGIEYLKADWNENFKQLNINTEKGVNIQANNNSYFQSGDKKLVVGNNLNSVEFRTDGVAKFKNVVNAANLQINGTSVMDKVEGAIKEAEKNSSGWYTIRNLVRLGLGAKLFPVGTQLSCYHSQYGEILWDVVAHNNNNDPTNKNKYSMTLLSHNIINNLQFDNVEALYYCENELSAGTYRFKLLEGFYENQGGGKQYQFTLKNSVPAGGVIVFPWGYGKSAGDIKISTYESNYSTSSIETVAVTEGTEGVFLGTADGNTANMNHSHRIRFGSDNWKESAIRQWLNSDSLKESVWSPQTIFDRPANWVESENGFIYGLDKDFCNVIGMVNNITIANGIFEYNYDVNSYYTTMDKFWLPSVTEMFGVVEGSGMTAQGRQFEYFENKENTDRIKCDLLGNEDVYWLRSPAAKDGAYRTRAINNSGSMSLDNSVMAHGIVIGCSVY